MRRPHRLLEKAAIVALLVLGVVLRLGNLHNVAGRSPDEMVYTRQANTVIDRGTDGLRQLVAEYQHDPSVRLFPPPTRVGYLWLLVATMRLTGNRETQAGAYVSCAASIGSLLLATWIGLRFFPAWATLFALVFFAVSPAELVLARRTWADALAGFAGLLLIYFAAEITRDSRRRIWHALFVLIGCLGIFVKESSAVVFALCALWIVWVLLVQRGQYKDALVLMAAGLVATAGTICAIAWSMGGVAALLQTLINWHAAHETNAYALKFQSGPGYLLLAGFWVISPLTTVCCLAGVALGLLSVVASGRRAGWARRLMDQDNGDPIGSITLLFLFNLAVAMLLPHYLNLRYVSALFGPFYLLGGVGFWFLAVRCRTHVTRLSRIPRVAFLTLLLGTLLLAAGRDYWRFQHTFVRGGLSDLSVKFILLSSGGWRRWNVPL